jgi:hypothetical protein
MYPDFDAVWDTEAKGLYYGRSNGFWNRQGWNILINISTSESFKISEGNNKTSKTSTQGLVLKTEKKSCSGPAAKPQCQDELRRGVGFTGAYMYQRDSLRFGRHEFSFILNISKAYVSASMMNRDLEGNGKLKWSSFDMEWFWNPKTGQHDLHTTLALARTYGIKSRNQLNARNADIF